MAEQFDLINPLNQEEDDKEKSSQAGGIKSDPVTLSSGAPGGGTGGTPMAAPTGSQRRGSGRFTNLQKYIQANQGAGQRLGSQIEGFAGKEQTRGGREAEQRLGNIRENIASERDRLGQAGQFAETISTGQTPQLQQLAADNLDAVTQLRTGQSQLPELQTQAGQSFTQLGGVADRLGNIAQEATTEAGRFGLLRQAVGDPRYTSGQRRLDQLILQGSGAQGLGELQQNLAQREQQQRDDIAARQETLGTDFTGLGDLVSQGQEQIQGALGAFQADGQGRLGQLRGALETAQQQRVAEDPEVLMRARQELERGVLSPEIAEYLGLSGKVNTFDLNLADYASQIAAGDTNVTLADVATQDQVDTLSALQALAGLTDDDVYLGEREGERLAFDQAQFLQDAAQAGQTLEDRFFDTNINEALGKEYFYGLAPDPSELKSYHAGYGLTRQELLDRQKEIIDSTWQDRIDKGNNVGQYLEQLAGTTPGFFTSRGWGNFADDMTSEEALAGAVDAARARQGQFQADASIDMLEALLNRYRGYLGNQVVVDPNAAQLESGGYFNVT